MVSASFSDISVSSMESSSTLRWSAVMCLTPLRRRLRAAAVIRDCMMPLSRAYIMNRINSPLPVGTEVDPVEFGKFRRNLAHGRRVVQSTRLAKKSAKVVLQLHAPATLALQSYMVCHSASLMIYGYMTGVYAGKHTASDESFGHGIIVVVNVYRAVVVRCMLLGLKAAHRLRSRLQAVQTRHGYAPASDCR